MQLALPSQPPQRTDVLAHRGFHDAAGPVENSLGAFQRAIDAGADLLETDSHRTRDGVIVLHHDAKLADGRRIRDLAAADLPLLADGQPIPRLTQLVDLVASSPRTVGLVVETKARGHEQQLVRELEARLPTDRFEVVSFSRASLRDVIEADPEVRVGLLAPRLPKLVRESAPFVAATRLLGKVGIFPALDRAARTGASYVSIEQRMATPELLRAAAERHLGVDVWTVEDPATMHRLLDAGVRGIVTDHPDLALAARADPAAPPPTRKQVWP